jgi:hypothetical protein
MDLRLRWHQPLALEIDRNSNGIYTVDLDAIPWAPGIYVFLRVHGSTSEALYIGKAALLQSRIRQHLNNLKLMKGIENAATGSRFLAFAEFISKPGQQQAKALKLLETAYIRYFLSNGDQLLNKQGTRISKSRVVSERSHLRKFIPKTLFFED